MQISIVSDTMLIPGKAVSTVPEQETPCYRVAYNLTTKKVTGCVFSDKLVTRFIGGLFAFTLWSEVVAEATTLGLTGLPAKDPKPEV